MEHFSTFVGMDVHAKSVTCKGIVKSTGEYKKRRFKQYPYAQDLINWLKSLPQPVYCAYESGCTGFALARLINKTEIKCDIIAITTLARSEKDKKNKCDKIDAGVILREILNPMPSYSVVRIPSIEIEAHKDLAREYKSTAKDHARAKQRFLSYLLKYGYVYNERNSKGSLKSSWTKDFWKWVSEIEFEFKEFGQIETLRSKTRKIKYINDELKIVKQKIIKVCERQEIKPYIDAYTLIKGIDYLTAYLLYAELGDLTNFTAGRKVSCWAGLTPKNNSSGEEEKHGGITKTGNKYIRKALIEGFAAIPSWTNSTKKLSARNADCSTRTLKIADMANKRIFEKFQRLHIENNKSTNKAKVAVANEAIRWIWILGLNVQKEISKKDNTI